MSTANSTDTDWFDRASDWCNPILVKEVRQSLKSRAFVTTFFLLLLGSWMISAIGLLAAGPAVEYGRVGQYFFIFYFGALCIALGAVVPYNAFRSLLNERDDNTFELLSITSLSPGQIVRGKWTCALVQALLFYSAIIPFIAFSSLLQGFNVVQALLLLVAALYGSVGLSITTLMLSTTVKQKTWQGLVSMLVMGGLGGAIAMTISGLSSLMVFQLPLDMPAFWWVVGVGVLISLSYMWLFYQIAAARLTFESENRSSGIRLTASGQLVLVWLIAAALVELAGFPLNREFLLAIIIASGAHLAVVGISASPELDGLSRRASRGLPRSALLRALISPLLPGGALGYLYLLVNLGILLIVSAYGWGWALSDPGDQPLARVIAELSSARNQDWEHLEENVIPLFALAMCCYIAIYCGLAAALVRWGRRITLAFEPVHSRTMIVILVATGMIIPMSLRVGRYVQFGETAVLDVLFPFWFLMEIMSQNALPWQFVIVLIATILVIGLNLGAMGRAIGQAISPPRPSASSPQPSSRPET